MTIDPGDDAGLLTIDLDALAENWRRMRARAGGAECAAVVKADAYGTGIERAVPALAKAGCSTFFVAHLSEARRVRALLPEATIYVLGGFGPGAAGELVSIGARPVLNGVEEAREWLAAGRGGADAALHVDTGMNRLGLSEEEALALKAQGVVDALAPALLMTHLVAAEAPEAPVNARQIAAFRRLAEALPGIPTSFCNSSGEFLPGAPVGALARPGYALYGGDPTPGRGNPMLPVVRLEAPILQVREVPDGATAGYGGRWTARGPRRLATIALGYADGYPRAAGGTDADVAAGVPRGVALVGGVRCPFAGTVSMDLTILDVTDAPRDAARRGEPAVLVGDGLEIDEVGARAGTIGYEILTSLGRRFRRVHRGG